ncbi:MAG: urate hydroxylase PuuD, partial [Comamonadaceae bacterium]|nr:urate hydroxylase PuuD [Comamonadaceae bacterium]
GFALLTVSYLWNANIYLVNPANPIMSSGMAIAVALSFLVVFWLLYNGICRIFGEKEGGDGIVGALVLVLVCIASYLACILFPGQAAFLLIGAMLATSMSANVFFWIIPGQRKMVASIKAGEPVDSIHGKRGKQRSVHNTYFTLPVLFAMLSNHYGWLHSHELNWVVLILMMFAGAAIRQFFVMRHGYKLGRNPHPWKYAAVGVVVLLGVMAWLKPVPPAATPANPAVIAPVGQSVMQGDESAAAPAAPAAATANASAPVGSYGKLHAVMQQHCVVCHSAQTIAQKNVKFDTAEEIKQHAQSIYQQVVLLRKMPFGNPGALTAEEREAFKAWFESGAPVQ